MTDLIKREDAIEAVRLETGKLGRGLLGRGDIIDIISALPSAEAEPTVIRSKTLMPTKDFKEWAKRLRETNPNAVVIPCDAEVISAEAEWIPCSERLPMMGEYVLTYRPTMGMSMIVDAYDGYYGEDDNEWYEGWIYGGDKVLAWMPLPKPCRKDGEEE